MGRRCLTGGTALSHGWYSGVPRVVRRVMQAPLPAPPFKGGVPLLPWADCLLPLRGAYLFPYNPVVSHPRSGSLHLCLPRGLRPVPPILIPSSDARPSPNCHPPCLGRGWGRVSGERGWLGCPLAFIGHKCPVVRAQKSCNSGQLPIFSFTFQRFLHFSFTARRPDKQGL